MGKSHAQCLACRRSWMLCWPGPVMMADDPVDKFLEINGHMTDAEKDENKVNGVDFSLEFSGYGYPRF